VYAAEHKPNGVVALIKVSIVINSLFNHSSLKMSLAKSVSLAAVLSLTTFATLANAAKGDAIARLNSFVTNVEAFSASFDQTLYGAGGEVAQSGKGTAFLKRPGQLIWRYEGEGAQEIIADGKNVWMLDKELEQVTVNPLDERVNGTPMVVLMGVGKLDDQFELSEVGQSEGIDWIKLIPKQAGADFESLFIGLRGEALAAMELRDSFGQATQIQFSDFKPNIKIDDDEFQFIPPEGVDVIGEPIN